MIRSALLVCAALLAALTFACVVVPPPPQVTPVRETVRTQAPIVATAVDCRSAAQFVASVKVLEDPTFTPDPLDPSSAPASNVSITNPKIITDLTNFFTLAPDSLKNELCGTSDRPGVTVFVQNCNIGSSCIGRSWGYRKRSTKEKFIALSAGLWQGTNSAPSYHDFENMVLRQLLGTNGPTYIYANNDSSEMTILAVMAHEMGHILWWDKSLMNSSRCEPPGPLPRMFWKLSWRSLAFGAPFFHQFGVQNNGVGGDQRLWNGPSKDDVVTSINSGHLGDAVDQIQSIYGGEWASLFADVSADEDFVETYKLYTLYTANTPLTALVVNIPFRGAVDMIQERLLNSSAKLFSKGVWFQNCINSL